MRARSLVLFCLLWLRPTRLASVIARYLLSLFSLTRLRPFDDLARLLRLVHLRRAGRVGTSRRNGCDRNPNGVRVREWLTSPGQRPPSP
jgi:hypothetical protein